MYRNDPKFTKDLPEADLARRVKAATAALVVLVLMFTAAAPDPGVDGTAPAHAATSTESSGIAVPAWLPAPEEEYERHAQAS